MCLTLILSTLTLVGISANAETSGDFEYSLLYDDTVEIIRYNGSATELEIPSTIDGKAVTSIYGTENHIITSGIDSSAFSECTSLITVTIPNSVINIGDNAFFSCTSLTSVTIPDSVTTIGDEAFENCTSLTSVTIPDSVTSIGIGAFMNCTALTSISVDENNEFYCAIDGVLFNIDMTKLIQYPVGNTRTTYEIPDGIKNINANAFQNCKSLNSITIPSSVNSISAYAFRDCPALPSVTIPDSVTGIGIGAFMNCTALTNVIIGKGVTKIGLHVFRGCTALKNVTIPDSVTVIDSYAFYGCTALKSITIPEKVTNIGLNAFTNCTALTSIAIPDSVTDIDSYAFSECAALTSVTIGSGLLTIDIFSFSDCTALKRITIPDNVTTIEFMALGYYWDKDIGDYIKVDDFTIIGNPNTEAERYANENDINFVDLTNHTHLYTEEITKQPTCTEKGVKTYTCFCSDSYTEEISVLGHKVVIDKAKSPTCTKTGLTGGKHCSVCGEVLVKQVVVPTKSHNCKWIVGKKASYFSKGTKSYKCSVCGKVTKTTTVAKLKLKTPSFSVSGGKKLFKVKYTKVTDATGFEVKYTIGKKTVTKTFSTKKSITKTISGLKKGSYKVRIRAFVKQSGKTAYSNWSKTKTVKVK